MQLDEFLALSQGEPIGVVNPGTLFGTDIAGSGRYVHGPRGTVRIPGTTDADSWAALIAAGSLLMGSAASARAVARLLEQDHTSRTASYLCSISTHCDELLGYWNKVTTSHVTIAGCGGIGSLAALLFAGMGVRVIRLIDGDAIERSNLNRQLCWNLGDVGQTKVEVLTSRIHERFPGVTVETRPVSLTLQNLSDQLSGSTGVLLTADEPLGIAIEAAKIAKADGFHLVTAGYALQEAGVILWSAADTACGPIRWMRSPTAVMPSFGPTNAFLAGIATSALFHAIIGKHATLDHTSVNWDTSYFPWGLKNGS